ncbi:MAG: type VI secretion system tube protein TssD [Janthinobacterium lividum]
MASYSAKLEVDGQTYPVVLCTYSFTQATGARGRANERVRHGLLELVLDVPAGDQLLLWAATPHRPLDGHVSFYQASELMARETVSFKAGECVSYQEVFEAGADLVGSYRCALTIAAPKLELTAGGPAGSAVSTATSAVTKVAAVATTAATVAATAATAAQTASAILPTKMAPPTGPWVDALESKLPPGSGIRTTLAGWAAAGVSMDALKTTFSAAADPQVVVNRLKEAGKQKGLYQMRVVADDYKGLPGVSVAPYVPNGLPPISIPASKFGVNDPSLDLSSNTAETFSNKAELVELKPGDKLYRVANDPASDPLGHSGGYWTRTPPAGLNSVVGGTAVVPEWNNFQRVYEFTVPTPADPTAGSGFHAWEGPAACQPVSVAYPDKRDNGYCLPGGDNQLFIPNKFTRSSDFGNHITDVTLQHKSW